MMVFIYHHILNRMNNPRMVLCFFADNHFIWICKWWYSVDWYLWWD